MYDYLRKKPMSMDFMQTNFDLHSVHNSIWPGDPDFEHFGEGDQHQDLWHKH